MMAERAEDPVSSRSPKFTRTSSKDSTSGSSSPRIGGRHLTTHSRSTSLSEEGTGGVGRKTEDTVVTATGVKEDDKEHSPSPPESDHLKKKSKDKKGKFSFAQIFTSSHRHKNDEIHKIFKSLPETEKLIDDYSCALQRDILIHGRLYVTQNWLCFYANIFSWETLLTIPFQSVQAITKEKTALVIPNAIQISTTSDKYGFSSLMSRDVTYNIIFRIWQNSLLDQALTPLELVRAARKAWGESTDVGTVHDLWGETTPKDVQVKEPMSLPTHVEIGHLPPSTIQPLPPPHDAATSSLPAIHVGLETHQEEMSLPTKLVEATPVMGSPGQKAGETEAVETRKGACPDSQDAPPDSSSRDAKAANHISGSDSGHVSSPTPLSPDHPERVSMGGDSIASSEFETISFTEENGEIDCGCAEHIGRTIINEVYSADAETVFQLLFTDSDFMRNFLKDRKTINIEIGDWQTQPDGTRLRDLSYTLALNYSFGPKYSPSTEHQMYSKMGQPGLKHIVDTEVVNGNIPYSDTFFVSCRYCMTRVAHDKTRVRITANINFKKSCWGLVKNLIERNAGDGVRSYFNHLDQFLKEYLGSLPAKKRRGHRRGARHSSRTRHRRQVSLTKPMAMIPQSSSPGGTPPHSPGAFRQKPNSTTTLKSFHIGLDELKGAEREAIEKKSRSSHSRVNLALTLLLGILILSNMALYHQLMSYQAPRLPQYSAATSRATTSQQPFEWPTSRDGWIGLVRYQLERHDQDLQHWRAALSGLVQSLEQIETTIVATKGQLLYQLESCRAHTKRPPETKWTETVKAKQNVDAELNNKEEL